MLWWFWKRNLAKVAVCWKFSPLKLKEVSPRLGFQTHSSKPWSKLGQFIRSRTFIIYAWYKVLVGLCFLNFYDWQHWPDIHCVGWNRCKLYVVLKNRWDSRRQQSVMKVHLVVNVIWIKMDFYGEKCSYLLLRESWPTGTLWDLWSFLPPFACTSVITFISINCCIISGWCKLENRPDRWVKISALKL